MAGNDGWAGRLRGRTDETGTPAEPRAFRLDEVPPVAPGRHLYVAYSADYRRDPSTTSNMPAPLQPPPSDTTTRGMLDRSVQVQIGRMLRDVFADVADEPVPERFVKLLEALEVKEKHG